MHVQALHLNNFILPGEVHVHLPERGLVVVSGPNGAGKSRLAEAVAFAFWGRTLRGTDPWLTGEVGSVRVTTTTMEVQRSVTAKGSKKLEWVPHDRNLVTYETATKAQAALEAHAGDLEVWRRTHVLSSQDAAHFTTATDAERKHLLEQILGLELFDQAWTKVRDDAAKLKVRMLDQPLALAVAQGRREGAVRVLSGLDQVQDPEPVEPAVLIAAPHALYDKERHEALFAERRELEVKLRAAGQALTRMEGERSNYYRRIEAIQAQLQASRAGDPCPVCGSTEYPERAERIRQLEVALPEAQQGLQDAQAGVDEFIRVQRAIGTRAEEVAASQVKLAESEYEFRFIAQRRSEWEREHRAWADRQASWNRQRAHALADLEEASASLEHLQHKGVVLAREQATLKAVEGVLGMKGVRAHVLSRALEGIEAVANGWLSRIAPRPMELRLKSYTTTKAGTTSEAISLEVLGAGGGKGYWAASGGERRRIDVALLLALAEVSAAAYGRVPGTLWLDEVLDSLDMGGVDAVAEALHDLAVDRAVVLITHSEALAARVPAAQRLHVSQGRIERR